MSSRVMEGEEVTGPVLMLIHIKGWKAAPRFQFLNSIVESHALYLPQSDKLKVSQVRSVYPRWLLDLLAMFASPEGNGGCWQNWNVIPSLSETLEKASCSCCLGSRCWVCVSASQHISSFFVSSMQIGQAKGGPRLRATLKQQLARMGWIRWRKTKASRRHIPKLRSTLLQDTFHSKLQKLKCFGHLKLNLTKSCVHTVGINFKLSQLWTRWPGWLVFALRGCCTLWGVVDSYSLYCRIWN